MDLTKHTISIPLTDYNKLMESHKLTGIQEMTPGNVLYAPIRDIISKQYPGLSQQQISRIKIYVKI